MEIRRLIQSAVLLSSICTFSSALPLRGVLQRRNPSTFGWGDPFSSPWSFMPLPTSDPWSRPTPAEPTSPSPSPSHATGNNPLSSSSPSASNAVSNTVTNNVAVYYGQVPQQSNASSLTSICADPSVDIVILAFLTSLFGPGSYPSLSLGANCGNPTEAQTNAGATGLVDCVSNGFSAQVAQCQANGKTVLLSVGGATGGASIPSEADAESMADTIWELFLGGGQDQGNGNNSLSALRPFGDVVLDGIDIDNEAPSDTYLDTFISSLRTIYTSKGGSRQFYLSAAPQCPLPSLSIPLSSMQTQLDFVWVQFYNNGPCDLNSGQGFLDSLRAWSTDLDAANNSTGNDSANATNNIIPKLYVGASATSAVSSGYVSVDDFAALLYSVQDAGIANLGGVMFWDGVWGEESKSTSSNGTTFMDVVKEVLH